jgi:hypothetical protein
LELKRIVDASGGEDLVVVDQLCVMMCSTFSFFFSVKFVKVYHEVGRSVERSEDEAVSRSLGDVKTGVEDDHDRINEFSIRIIIISRKDD